VCVAYSAAADDAELNHVISAGTAGGARTLPAVREQRTTANSPALQCWENIVKLAQSAKWTTEQSA
jgi:hypothetical protein